MTDHLLPVQIARFFSDHLHLKVPAPEVDLFDAEMLDSLSFVELLMHLEQEFDIRISVDELEMENFRSIAKIIKFITDRNRMDRASAA